MSSLLLETLREGESGGEIRAGWRAVRRGSVNGWRFSLQERAGSAVPRPGPDVSVSIDKETGQVRLARELTAIRSLFYRVSADGLLVSDDPGLIRARGAEPDPRALAGILVFGTLMAPASPWIGVSQVRPGMELSLELSGLSVREVPLAPREETPPPIGQSPEKPGRVRDALGSVVSELSRGAPPLVLFSGGVDSALLALASRDLGFTSTPLLHCSMGPEDPETAHAGRVAEALKLPFEVVTFRPAETLRDFPGLLGDYPVPFSDYSILPTWFLTGQALRVLTPGAVALDGTGADAVFGQFGAFRRWTSFYRVPRVLREAAARLYGPLGCYLRDGRLDRFLRKPQRTRGYRPEFANLVVHPMEGIGLRVPPEVLLQLESEVLSWAGRVLPEDDEVRFCLIDVVHQCRGVLAQKNAPVFAKAGASAEYPFLHPELLRLAMDEVRFWPGQLEPKAILKEVLASEIGRDLVYRPKSGFVLPQVETFGHPVTLGLLEDVLREKTSLLSTWIDRPVLGRLLGEMRAKRRLALYTYSYLWAVLVAHHWYRACDRPAAPS